MARGTGGAPGRHAALRESLVDHGRRMVHDGLVDGVSGNLSARAGDLIAITLSGVPYQDMQAFAWTSAWSGLLDGSTAAGACPPLSPRCTGRTGHRRRSDRTPIRRSWSRCPRCWTSCPRSTTPWPGWAVGASPPTPVGTQELADGAVAALRGRTAVILRNHGALTYGATLEQAYDRARTLEWLASVYWHARMAGRPKTLTAAQLDEVREATRAIRYGEGGP
jgi:L-fuculose-phosphate aldolase